MYFVGQGLYLLGDLDVLNNRVLHLTSNDGLDLSLGTGFALAGVPGAGAVFGEHELHFLNCLAARLWVETKNHAAAAQHRTPKMMNNLHSMLMNAGGVNMPRAKLKTQFDMAANGMPVARVPSDQTSAAY